MTPQKYNLSLMLPTLTIIVVGLHLTLAMMTSSLRAFPDHCSAADLNCKQYFKLFEKFMLCVGMDPKSIRSGAMSLVFNDWTNEEEQRKVCKEYELTMDEDLEKKYQDFKERDAQWAKLNAHYEDNFGSEPKIKGDWEQMTDEEREHQWETSYWQLYRRFQRFAKYTDEQLEVMADMYEQSKLDGVA